ncbi:NRDE family protein [Rubritalea marina]|uniref:NRDE family protein n=1 Tax=Rubritalea marina TaxID=361055 RepID=UPI00038149F0|nr:NRDE family protein [Rubritalea marina]
MCTVSWKWAHDSSKDSQRLSVYFNRDELKAREEAHPPKEEQIGHYRSLLPTDPKRGGTWIAANETQLVVCLLNLYSVPPTPERDYASRGMVVRAMMAFNAIEPALEQLGLMLKENLYPAFTIILWDAKCRQQRLYQWDESKLIEVRPPFPFYTSSSWQTDDVQASRQAAFVTHVIQGRVDQASFHATTPEGQAWSSVYMCRDLTMTVSRTQIHVHQDQTHMEYHERRSDTLSHSVLQHHG